MGRRPRRSRGGCPLTPGSENRLALRRPFLHHAAAENERPRGRRVAKISFTSTRAASGVASPQELLWRVATKIGDIGVLVLPNGKEITGLHLRQCAFRFFRVANWSQIAGDVDWSSFAEFLADFAPALEAYPDVTNRQAFHIPTERAPSFAASGYAAGVAFDIDVEARASFTDVPPSILPHDTVTVALEGDDAGVALLQRLLRGPKLLVESTRELIIAARNTLPPDQRNTTSDVALGTAVRAYLASHGFPGKAAQALSADVVTTWRRLVGVEPGTPTAVDSVVASSKRPPWEARSHSDGSFRRSTARRAQARRIDGRPGPRGEGEGVVPRPACRPKDLCGRRRHRALPQPVACPGAEGLRDSTSPRVRGRARGSGGMCSSTARAGPSSLSVPCSRGPASRWASRR